MNEFIHQIFVLSIFDLAETALEVATYFAFFVGKNKVITGVGFSTFTANEGRIENAVVLMVSAKDQAGVLKLTHIYI